MEDTECFCIKRVYYTLWIQYPIFALGSILDLSSFSIWAEALHARMRKYFSFGWQPFHTFYGVIACTELVEHMKMLIKFPSQFSLAASNLTTLLVLFPPTSDSFFQLLHFALVFWEQWIHGVYFSTLSNLQYLLNVFPAIVST